MKTKLVIGILLLAAISCKKEPIEPVNNPAATSSSTGNTSPGDPVDTTNTLPSPGSVSTFFKENQVASQFFTINAGNQNTIQGSKGTILTLYANSLVTPSNVPVSGNISIELKEIYSKKDMILSNKTTTTSDGLLISGGEIYVKATQNGQELKLAPGTKMETYFPTNNNPWSGVNMQIFYGTVEDSTAGITWATNTNSTIVASTDSVWFDTSTVTTTSPYYYNLQSDSLNYINCDYFYNGQPITNVFVKVPENLSYENTAVFIVFNELNMVAGFHGFQDHAFNLGYSYRVPIGINATIVSITEIEGSYYSSFTPITVNADHTVSVSPTSTSLAVFKDALDGL